MDKKKQKPRATRVNLRTMPQESSGGHSPHPSERNGGQSIRRKGQHRELDGFVSSVPQSSGVHRSCEQGSTDTPAPKVDAELTQAQIGLPIIIIGVFIWIIYFVFYAN